MEDAHSRKVKPLLQRRTESSLSHMKTKKENTQYLSHVIAMFDLEESFLFAFGWTRTNKSSIKWLSIKPDSPNLHS